MGNVHSRIASLQERHASLDAEIIAEQARPLPDSLRIKALKKEKLRVKQELNQLISPSSEQSAVAVVLVQSGQPSAEIIDFSTHTSNNDEVVAVDHIKIAVG